MKPCEFQIESKMMGRPKIRGPVYRLVSLAVGDVSPVDGNQITKYTPDWARLSHELVAPCATLSNPRESGHQYEGRVKIKGKSYSAFTDGGVDDGMIIVRGFRKES